MGHALRMTPEQVSARAKRLGNAAKPAKPHPSKPRKVFPTEHQEQAALIQWWKSYSLGRQIHEKLLFAIPNASRLTNGGRLYKWAEGLRAGVPDLMLAVPKYEKFVKFAPRPDDPATYAYTPTLFSGLFIEMKRQNTKATPEQLEFADLLRRQGYNVVICQGFEEAKRAIVGYLET